MSQSLSDLFVCVCPVCGYPLAPGLVCGTHRTSERVQVVPKAAADALMEAAELPFTDAGDAWRSELRGAIGAYLKATR